MTTTLEALGRWLFTVGAVIAAAAAPWLAHGVPAPSPVALAWSTLAVSGLLAGWLAGLLGIGGALVTVPALYLALPGLGIADGALPATVVATALATMIPTTVATAWSQHRRGAIAWGWLGRLSLPMAGGAALGALVASQSRGPFLALLFAAQSLYFGLRLMCERGAPDGVFTRFARKLPSWLAGSSIGTFCACVGMGSGSMMNPYLRSRGLDLTRAVATASALNLCLAACGTAAFAAMSLSAAGAGVQAFWPGAVVIAAAAVVAAPYGVALAHRLPKGNYRVLVGAANAIGGVAVVLQALRGVAA